MHDEELVQAESVMAGLAGIIAPGVVCLFLPDMNPHCLPENVTALRDNGLNSNWLVQGEVGHSWWCSPIYLHPIGFTHDTTEGPLATRLLSGYEDGTLNELLRELLRRSGRIK